MKTLKGKVALVTGATSGIGKAVAMMYSARGAKVMISGRNAERGQQLADEIKAAGGTARFYQADVSDPVQCQALITETTAAFGQLDIACNNAGISGKLSTVAGYKIEDWREIIDTNLSSIFYCMKYELEVMLQQETRGTIVNMSSALGVVGTPHLSGYVASKHGIIGLTKAAALEYATEGIRINAVGPAYIETAILDAFPAEGKSLLAAAQPVGRMGRAEEVAELVTWLSSDGASFATGSFYPIDGGYLACGGAH